MRSGKVIATTTKKMMKGAAFHKEFRGCCVKCYHHGLFTKCSMGLKNYNGMYCISQMFSLILRPRACKCGRFKVGNFCTCERKIRTRTLLHRVCKPVIVCQSCKLPKTNAEIICCRQFHPYFSKKRIANHMSKCFSCNQNKTTAEFCLQWTYNAKVPQARNLRKEVAEEMYNFLLARKLRSGRVISILKWSVPRSVQ